MIAMRKRLEALGRGGDTLHGSPQDEVKQTEKDIGRKLTSEEAAEEAAFYGIKRGQLDANDRLTALHVLTFIEQELRKG